ncbi:unnamed protein product, partial [Ectocarpus sp. 12 AP-2014]
YISGQGRILLVERLFSSAASDEQQRSRQARRHHQHEYNKFRPGPKSRRAACTAAMQPPRPRPCRARVGGALLCNAGGGCFCEPEGSSCTAVGAWEEQSIGQAGSDESSFSFGGNNRQAQQQQRQGYWNWAKVAHAHGLCRTGGRAGSVGGPREETQGVLCESGSALPRDCCRGHKAREGGLSGVVLAEGGEACRQQARAYRRASVHARLPLSQRPAIFARGHGERLGR